AKSPGAAVPAALEEREEGPADVAAAANVSAPAVAENAAAMAEEEAEPPAPPPAWTVQPGGHIRFSVDNGGETISGGFSKWTARIRIDPDHPDTADIRVEIDLASASVGDAYQNGMLAGEEFFGISAHPRAIFTAKGAERTRAGRYRAAGTLSLKGVSRPQAIRFALSGSGKTRAVSGTATIARLPFGVGTGDSAAGLAPRVTVTFAFDARAD
ncbi:MAG TPA: YceI family protein, partial [Sphingobium sp.]|nr:YceI family protein [Sphingobium sp.]